MPPVRKKLPLLDGIDQYSAYYSVICVFGSVVGCVVVPLITQSIESIIFSAIIISLTAKTIHSRSSTPKEDLQDDRRKTRDGFSQDRRVKRKKAQLTQQQRVVDKKVVQGVRKEDSLKLQEQRQVEREQKLEEKRLKKARKREEKLKQKEEEDREREREAQWRKERENRKAEQKQKKNLLAFGSLESIDSIVRQYPLQRERKNSSSSSGSSRSSRSLPRPRPPRMNPRRNFSRASSDSNLVFPLPPSPLPSLHPTLNGISSPAHVQLPSTGQKSTQYKSSSSPVGNKTLLRVQGKGASHSPLPQFNHSSNNNLSPPPSSTITTPPGQVYAVNPLAPSNTTSVTPETVSRATIAKGNMSKASGWNEQMYYWSLQQSGLALPLQYGWDPVTATGCESRSSLTGSLPLVVQPSTVLWAPGPSSAPGESVNTADLTPPSLFGAIGKASSGSNSRTLRNGPGGLSSPSGVSAAGVTALAAAAATGESGLSTNGGYSLFSGCGKSLFDGSILSSQFGQNTQASDVTTPPEAAADGNSLVSTNEGVSPQSEEEGKYDEWPAL